MSPALPPLSQPLTERTLRGAVAELSGRDRDLAVSVARFGPPPLWQREPGFGTLVQIILEQQVSLSSARAAHARLLDTLGDRLTPAAFLGLDDAALLAIGFSRQKARYVRELAGALTSGRLDLEAVGLLDDAAVLTSLLAQTGIGPWTATIYLLMVLRRPDAWPAGDIALASAAAEVKGLAQRPGHDALLALAEPWRPYRAVAARILWHHYLSVRGRA